jgi:hypothetical protein
MRRFIPAAALLLALVALPLMARGQAAVQSVTGGTQFSSFDSNGDTVGWFFTVSSPIVATDLGFWDAAQDGLAGSHQVAIWNGATQALLGSTTVPAGTAGALVGQWRYAPVTPIALVPGTEYVIGAYYNANPPGPIDNYLSGVTGVSMLPGITLTASARDNFPAGGGPNPLAFPSVRGTPNGRFGPNFLVPEPASLGVLCFAGLVLLRRR